MTCMIEEPPAGWPKFWLTADTLDWLMAFCLDLEYSSKVPRISIFFLFLEAGAGLDADLRRWSVLPFFLEFGKKGLI